MPRPAIRRGLAAVLAGAALLSACTGNADEATDTEHTPAVAPSAASTKASSLVGAAVTAAADDSTTGESARAKVFVGAALESANAYAKTLPGRSAADKANVELSTSGVKVLAISRGEDAPSQVLAQTTLAKTGAAVLVLLKADKPGGEYKVAAVTPMLPGAKLDAFDATTEGAGAVGQGEGLVASPDAVAQAFADSVRFPAPKAAANLAEDALSEQLRQSATAQSQALAGAGTLTQEHEPKSVIGGLRLKEGTGAVVFLHLVRTDSIAMRRPVRLTPAKDLTLLTGIKQITSEATLTSNEIVAVVIPATGKARVVAASDQLVAGSGR